MNSPFPSKPRGVYDENVFSGARNRSDVVVESGQRSIPVVAVALPLAPLLLPLPSKAISKSKALALPEGFAARQVISGDRKEAGAAAADEEKDCIRKPSLGSPTGATKVLLLLLLSLFRSAGLGLVKLTRSTLARQNRPPPHLGENH